jgi:hypothetical protein
MITRRGEAVDLVSAFCYGSLEPKTAGKNKSHEMTPDAGSHVNRSEWEPLIA